VILLRAGFQLHHQLQKVADQAVDNPVLGDLEEGINLSSTRAIKETAI
jgi:hypothetical protein